MCSHYAPGFSRFQLCTHGVQQVACTRVGGETKDDIEVVNWVLQLNMQLITDDNGQLLFVHHARVVQVRLLERVDQRSPSLFRSIITGSRGAAAKGHVGRALPRADGTRWGRHFAAGAVRRCCLRPPRRCLVSLCAQGRPVGRDGPCKRPKF